MKKVLSLLLAIILILSAFSCPATALEVDDTYEGNDDIGWGDLINPTFNVVSGELTRYNGDGGKVIIPAGVTVIGGSSFLNCADVTCVIIPEGVTEIKGYAFQKCTGLKSIVIPKSVTKIGSSAFSGCTSLEAVWYLGSATDKATLLTISSTGNSIILNNNIWHYNSCPVGAEHDYKYEQSGSGHIQKCRVCNGTTEMADHRYTNNCDADCNDCGATRTPPHNYSDEYSSDATEHWYQCDDCESRKDAEEHNFESDFTTDDDYHWHKCSDCGAVEGEKVKHTFDNADDSICNECERAVEHKFDDECDGECNGCGAHRNPPHKYSQAKDETGHWQECELCHSTKDFDTHGYSNNCDASCDCGFIRTPPHSFDEEYKSDANKHWYECTCGAKDGESSHSYAADCDTTCNDCGRVRSTAKSHTYDDQNDLICNVCSTERATGGHFYDDAQDMLCNGCGFDRFPKAVTSAALTIKNSVISKITAGMTAKSLISQLSEGEYCKIYSGTKEVSSGTAVGTGMTVKLINGTSVKATYTVVVTGDINGDGGISITDMVSAKSQLLGKTKLSGAYLTAADTNGDGAVSITDFVQIKAKILGKGSITAR